MKYQTLALLFIGATALKGPGQGDFAAAKCRKDNRVTELKAAELSSRMLHLKTARPWMLEKYDPTAVKEQTAAPSVDLHAKRSDAMCARAEVMKSSTEVSQEEILSVRKKCLEAKIAVAQDKKASALIEGPSFREKVHSNGKPTLEETMAMADQQSAINIKKVFYINLDKDTDRQRHMEESLKQTGLEYERVSAVTAEQVAKMPKEKNLPRELWQFSSKGDSDYMKWFPAQAKHVTHAIYLSQARLLKKISEEDNNSDDVYIVMEDDVHLKPSWKEELLEKAKTLPKDWDMAKFVYWGIKRCEDKVPDSSWFEFRGPAMWSDKVNAMYSGNQAYMFRAKSIKNILEQLRGMPVMDVDGAMISNHQEKTEKIDGVDTPTVWGMHSYAIDMPLGRHKKGRNGRWSKTEFSNPVVAGGAVARTVLR